MVYSAVAGIRPLAWELSYATGMVEIKKEREEERKEGREEGREKASKQARKEFLLWPSRNESD